MIQRPSQEEIEKGLAEFKGDYKRLLRNITNCLEFDYKAICSLRTLLADSKEDIAEIKRTIRPYVVDLIYVLILDEKDLNSGEYGVDEELREKLSPKKKLKANTTLFQNALPSATSNPREYWKMQKYSIWIRSPSKTT